MREPVYPTADHERAADEIVVFFAAAEGTHAVLVTNSCARGKATPDSCLDVQVVADEPEALQAEWDAYAAGSPAIAGLRRAGRFSDLHLDVGSGTFAVEPIDEGPIDMLEVGVGNLFVYAAPVWVRGSRLAELRAPWLPYYDEQLRLRRLDGVRGWTIHNLEHIPLYLDRGLWFQSFDRLYRAFQGLLMGVHVARATYPISYDKWIHEQVVENLGLPQLYERLPPLLQVSRLESRELEDKARELRALVEEYVA